MSEPNKLWAPTVFLWLGLLITSGFILFVIANRQYYLLPAALRPMHPQHDYLRSSGYGGLTFGAIGTVLIFLNLTYLIRKEMVNVNWLGNLRSWMAFHVFTGFMGGMFIVLHSSFLPRAALGILAFTAFAIVIVTGTIGRYIYAHTPRSLEGSELEMDDLRKRLKDYRANLEKMGIPQDIFKTILEPLRPSTENKGILGSLKGMFAGDQQLKQTYNELEQIIKKSPTLRPLIAEIMPLAQRYYKELQWLSRYQELRGLMGTWRFFHRWLAIVMIAAVVFHIYVAWAMGNLWLFDAMRFKDQWAVAKSGFSHMIQFTHFKNPPSLDNLLSHLR